jgi:RNA polymerase sigma-B factor
VIVSLALMCALAVLSDREREVVIDRYVGGQSQKQIGERYGITGQSIGAIEARALAKMRGVLDYDAELAA